jgi:hypothetical protein
VHLRAPASGHPDRTDECASAVAVRERARTDLSDLLDPVGDLAKAFRVIPFALAGGMPTELTRMGIVTRPADHEIRGFDEMPADQHRFPAGCHDPSRTLLPQQLRANATGASAAHRRRYDHLVASA